VNSRRATRPVRVGPLVIGGPAPIAVQSMTTTTPRDLRGSLAQIAALARAGCELVRLAVPSPADAEALAPLRAEMAARGLAVPLAADVHFRPEIALAAAAHVEKVRINPGNFAPDADAARRLLGALIERLRERGAALRIGVNHGSLPAFIADRAGHGPEAMVRAALLYLRLCRDGGFDQVVVSLKASNPVTMIAANRLLVERLDAEGMDTPIHLGVTEAGLGAEGILRSAVGIGPLLADGIGDTLRVSLAGDPAAEIPVCRAILRAVDDACAQSVPGGATPFRCGAQLVPGGQGGSRPRPRLAAPGPAPDQPAPIVEVALDAGRLAGEEAGAHGASPDPARLDVEAPHAHVPASDARLEPGSIPLRGPESFLLRVRGPLAPPPRSLRARLKSLCVRLGIPWSETAALRVEFDPAAAGPDSPDPLAAQASFPEEIAEAWRHEGITGLSLVVPLEALLTAGVPPAAGAAGHGARGGAWMDRASAWLAWAARRLPAAGGDGSPRPHPRLHWHVELGEGVRHAERERSAEGEASPLEIVALRLARETSEAGLGTPGFSLRGRGLLASGRSLARALARFDPTAPGVLPCMPPEPEVAAVAAGTLLLEHGASGLIVTLPGDLDPRSDPSPAEAESAESAESTESAESAESTDAVDAADAADAARLLALADELLQATRRRLTHAEFIACPGCGRLHFDLPAVVARLKARFGHVAGVKIAVMGCVVNGPGEMADADFGYVGSGSDRVDLYAGREPVSRGLTPEEAEEILAEWIARRRR